MYIYIYMIIHAFHRQYYYHCDHQWTPALLLLLHADCHVAMDLLPVRVRASWASLAKATSHCGWRMHQLITWDFHQWGVPKMDGLFHGKSHWNRWFGGTLISGNLQLGNPFLKIPPFKGRGVGGGVKNWIFQKEGVTPPTLEIFRMKIFGLYRVE